MDDDDYQGMFITQESKVDNIVSLEENNEFVTVRDDEYSDVSDFEDDGLKRRIW